MARSLGPTITRVRLGRLLRDRRQRAGLNLEEAASELDCSPSKIQTIEKGDVKVGRGDLLLLLERYGVDAEGRETLLELQRLGRQRAWWAPYGRLPDGLAAYLDLEAAAAAIRAFEPLLVPGLLQTEEYARAITEQVSGPIPAEELERQVEIRMERQRRVLDEDPPVLSVVLDEAVLRRPVGGAAVMRAQLQRLLAATQWCRLRVVPFQVGQYAGQAGGFTVFEYDQEIRDPVVYFETRTGAFFQDGKDDVIRHLMAFSELTKVALDQAATAELIRSSADPLRPAR